MSTTVTSPNTFAQAGTAGLTLSYTLAEELEMGLQDQLGASLIQFMGMPIDLSGSGSDTRRIGVLSGVAKSKAFAASSDEVTLSAGSSITLDYYASSVAQYDLSYTNSVKSMVLGLPGVTVTTDDLKRFLPDNWVATIRALACTAGSGFSDTIVGTTSTDLGADEIFDLAAAATRKLGAGLLGMPACFLDPEQFITARNSFRSEPSWISNLAAMQQIQKIQAGQDLGDVFGLGFTVSITDAIVQASSAYRGFCGSPGSIKRVIADPSRARIPAGVTPIFLPDFGIVVYDLLKDANAATFGWQALLFGGAAQASATSNLQIRVTSKV